MKNLSFTRAIALSALIAVPALAAQANDDSIPASPAYVDFGELAQAYGEPRIMIDIDSALLQLVGAIKHKDPVANAALKDLEAIHVHVFDTYGELEPALERMTSVSGRLVNDQWERIVRAREEGKNVEIFMKQSDSQIHGLAVMAVDNEEAVFINILGSINPEDLAEIMAQVDVDVDL